MLKSDESGDAMMYGGLAQWLVQTPGKRKGGSSKRSLGTIYAVE